MTNVTVNSIDSLSAIVKTSRSCDQVAIDFIQFLWEMYISDIYCFARVLELSRWKDVLEDLLQKLLTEIRLLSDEKANTDKDIESITHPLRITSECISMRDCRKETELTYDEADIELKKELCMIANVHEALTKRWSN